MEYSTGSQTWLVGTPDARKRACPVWGGLGGNRPETARRPRSTPLREVVIVGQDFRETFTAHGLHGNTIREAIFLVGPGFIQRKAFQEEYARLGNNRPLRIAQRLSDCACGTLSDRDAGATARRKKFRQHLINSREMIGGQRLAERQNPTVPPVSWMRKSK